MLLQARQDFSNIALTIYKNMVTSRLLDERMLILLKQGKSFFHISGAGHEATQVGAALAFDPQRDWAYPYYRDQAFVLQWGISVKELLRNFLARTTDPSSCGRQMPQHYGHAKKHIVTQSSSTGTQFLQAVGTAMGLKKNGANQVVYVSSGEGTCSQGDFYEAINWAARDWLPVIFFIQDNQYAISVPREQQASGRTIYELVKGYKNLHRHEIDGLLVRESFETTQHCVDLAREGKGPGLILSHVVRLFSHSSSDDQRKYRQHDELEQDKIRDPLTIFKNDVIDRGELSENRLQEVERDVKKNIDIAVQKVLNEPMPAIDQVEKHLFNGSSFSAQPEHESRNDDNKVTMVDAINHALHEEMASNPNMLIYGQDVADKKGGVFAVTRGLSSQFGNDRVFNSPLAESSIIGTAIGLSVIGYRPVVEIQFGDYIWTSMMQIRNELSTIRYRSAGSFNCPVTIRIPVGGYIHGGLCHSQNIEGFFAHIPGLYICYPSNARDAKGLLKQAMRLQDPVLFLEHKGLYRQSYAMSSEPDKDFLQPFGQAAIKRTGRDVTIVTWGMMVHKSLAVAKKLSQENIEAEVIDIRTMVPLDLEMIYSSVRKTSRILVVHEDTLGGGFGAEIAANISDKVFRYLDAPIKRVAAKDTPIPFNWELEKAVLPQEADIYETVKELIHF